MKLHTRDRLTAGAVLILLTLSDGAVSEAFAQGGGARLGERDAPATTRKRPVRRSSSAASARKRQAPPAGDDARAGGFVEEGLRRADARDWAEAIKSYRQALAASPRHADAHIHLGDAYMSLGKTEEAFAAYKEAVRVAPSNPEAHYALGAAYNDMAQYGDAFKPFVQAVALDPGHAEAHHGIGYAYLKLENFKDALPYLRRAVAARPDYAEAHLSLGLAYLGLRQTKAAEQQLRLLESADAALARELDKEMRGADASARETAPPKSDGPGGADAGARGVKLGAAQSNGRDTAGAVTPRLVGVITSQPPPPSTRGRPPQAEADAKGASDSPARTPRTAEVARAESQPAPPSSLLAVELSFWESIKNSSDPAEFEAYLKKYPQGEFAELARIRLRALAAKRVEATTAAAVTPENAPAAPEPRPTPEPEPRPTPDPLAETLQALKREFPNRFTYKATAPGEDAGVVAVTSEVLIEYEPLRFDDCRLEWRETKDVLSVSLADLDPLGVKVEERSRPGTTFSVPVWNLSLATEGGRQVIRESKGGGGAVNDYNGLDLQFDNREKAERLARLFQTAIKLCADGRENQ